MPVTEVATLQLVFPHTWDSPDVRAFFQTLSIRQADWSGYPLCFFEDLEDPRTIYLITLWESVPAHYEWIASAQNQELLKKSKETLTVVDLEHVEMASNLSHARVAVLTHWTSEDEGAVGGYADCGRVLERDDLLLCAIKEYPSEAEAASDKYQGGRKIRKKMRRLDL